MQAINWCRSKAMDARDPPAVEAQHAAGTVPLIRFPDYGASGGRLADQVIE